MGYISFDAPIAAGDRDPGREPPPGRDIAEQLARGIAAAGFEIVEPLGQHESYGWAFSARDADGRPVWCMLQLSDEWLVVTHTPSPMFRRLLGGPGQSAAHDRFDAAAVRALAVVPAVTNVRWFRSEDDLKSGNAGHP
jgi:hypothetical protein